MAAPNPKANLIMAYTHPGMPFDGKSMERMRTALICARMCERLAHRVQLPSTEMFAAGFLSMIDPTLVRLPAHIMHRMSAPALILEALQGGASMPARLVEVARHQRRGYLMSLAGTGLSAQAAFLDWYDAVCWVNDIPFAGKRVSP